jgi:hypothetical protein
MDAGFCWVELATTDRDRATWFYVRLMGWAQRSLGLRTSAGMPVDYSLLGQGDLIGGGLYQMLPGLRAQGQPPHWMPYAAVEDVSASLRRARELGAQVLVPPLAFQDFGHMALLRDPLGAAFGLWQPWKPAVTYLTRDQSGFARWFEHGSSDVAGAADFYCALLGWKRSTYRVEAGEYVVLERAGEPMAGITRRPDSASTPRWLTFFQVADCEASCAKVSALQGSVLSPPLVLPGAGKHAVVSDPQGAAFGLFAEA